MIYAERQVKSVIIIFLSQTILYSLLVTINLLNNYLILNYIYIYIYIYIYHY